MVIIDTRHKINTFGSHLVKVIFSFTWGRKLRFSPERFFSNLIFFYQGFKFEINFTWPAEVIDFIFKTYDIFIEMLIILSKSCISLVSNQFSSPENFALASYASTELT